MVLIFFWITFITYITGLLLFSYSYQLVPNYVYGPSIIQVKQIDFQLSLFVLLPHKNYAKPYLDF